MSLKVNVVDLVGRSLELELPAKETVKALKDAVATPWDLDPRTFRLLAQGEHMDEEKTFESFLSEGEKEVQVQLLKFDPLWNLGQFVRSKHRGIRISGKGGNVLKQGCPVAAFSLLILGFPYSTRVLVKKGASFLVGLLVPGNLGRRPRFSRIPATSSCAMGFRSPASWSLKSFVAEMRCPSA